MVVGEVTLDQAPDEVKNGNEGESREVKGRCFHHPYTPYKIQEVFMETVYQVLETGGGQVGILESPTGTGKSLSLICASLTWLRDHKRKRFEEGLEWGEDAADEPGWIIEQARARKRRELLRQREDMETRLAKIRAKEKAQQEKYSKETHSKRRRTEDKSDGGGTEDETQFMLDDYDSDRDGTSMSVNGNATRGLSAETLALMEKLGMNIGAPKKEEEEELEDEIKIFYCSRTHSQLAQFINELRRVRMPPTLPAIECSDGHIPDYEVENFKHLTLGSRKNLCINASVSKFSSVTAINERCLELQQPNTPSDKKCSYVPNKENRPLINSFRDHSLASIRDIEELASLGREIGICPYYASRSVIKPSEIITLPYPLLLQKSAREALGINLKGHVIIIDEAHNLMDAISGIHGISVTLSQLKRSRAQLGVYLQKFRNRLMGKNRVYVAQVLRLLDSLAGYLEARAGSKAEDVVEPGELLAGKGVDQINLYKLLRYLQESKLARKVEGYITHAEQQSAASSSSKSNKSDATDPTTPTLQHITSLLAELTNPSAEGKLFYSNVPATSVSQSSTSLKYLLLDPTHSFHTTISEARAVLLAGGTMSPMSDYTSHLLSYLPTSQITTLSCGHVIPKENLIAWTLGNGPTGKAFEFTYGKRGGREGEEMLDELGRTMLNICSVVPDGVVVFFPSYKVLESVKKRWQTVLQDGKGSVWERLGTKKALFTESKEAKGGEDVLTEYAAAIGAGKGGLLLSVVGGKMSEGINFSDRLGRCVIIVGLPFPNIQSGEWKAKLGYIESATEHKLESEGIGEVERKARGKQAGMEFYENACMRAVNQSIGRAIRHREDYAVIVMVDKRFGNERIRKKLPGWIQAGLVEGSDGKPFVELIGRLPAFFRTKKK